MEALSRFVPNASFETIPRAGHLPCIEQPRILAGRIESFIRRVIRRDPSA
jgi:pimeloyl-ACP methyl ester carboxylesterase